MTESIMGRVHSIQSMGALDGPGIRFVVFAQGCPLRCGCCHNPDTWAVDGGKQYSASELAHKAARYKDYFGKDGGVTVSGGEPLLQPEFVREFFRISHELCMNTCLDTSGCVLNDSVMALLKETDRVLLDIKYASDELYRANVGFMAISVPAGSHEIEFVYRAPGLRVGLWCFGAFAAVWPVYAWLANRKREDQR